MPVDSSPDAGPPSTGKRARKTRAPRPKLDFEVSVDVGEASSAPGKTALKKSASSKSTLKKSAPTLSQVETLIKRHYGAGQTARRQWTCGDFVWVAGHCISHGNDDALRPWWPSRVVRSASSTSATIRPYGNALPATIDVPTGTSNLLPFRCPMALFDQLKGDGLQSETYRANFHTALDALYASEEEQHAESSSDDGLPTIAKAVAGAGMLCRGSPSTPATASASAGVKPATKKRNVAAKSSTGKGKNVGTPSETNTSVEGKKRATPRGPRKTSEVPPLTLRDVLTAEDLSQLSSDNSEESDAQVYTIQPALPMGEKVLARRRNDTSGYHPALVMSSRRKTSYWDYELRFWDGRLAWMNEDAVVAQSERRFYTVKISPDVLAAHALDDEYTDDTLATRIDQLTPELRAIMNGDDPDCWRYENFMAGGRKRALLGQSVTAGPFTTSEYYFIMRYLQEKFCPSKAGGNVVRRRRTADEGDDEEDDEIDGAGVASQLDRVNLVCTVLLPETIIKLIEQRESVSREDAERIMMSGSNADWVSSILQARELHDAGMSII